jgi:hypothetical protein
MRIPPRSCVRFQYSPQAPQIHVSSNRDQVSHPYKTKDKIVILYDIFLASYFDRREEGRRSGSQSALNFVNVFRKKNISVYSSSPKDFFAVFIYDFVLQFCQKIWI